jgi:parallel beta-helix repeat protein
MKFTRPNLSTTRLAAVVFCTIIVLLAATSAQAATPCITLSAPGTYILPTDVLCPGADAILITASHVTLKLNGHNVSANANAIHAVSVSYVVILGPGSAYTADQGCGVKLEGLVTHSQVIGVTATQNAVGICLNKDTAGNIPAHNRVVANKANGNTTGIYADASQSNVYLGNECSNEGTGFYIASGTGDLIEGNKCNTNTSGIEFIGTGETVVGNEADGNINVGIFVQGGTGNSLSNNEATGNGIDLDDNNGVCPAPNSWRLNAFVTSNLSCIH